MKLIKQNGHQWISIGCPEKHPDIDIYHASDDAEHGVRCCSVDGSQCTSSHSLMGTSEKCHFKTFNEAKDVCLNKESGNFRLCTREELNTCCDAECHEIFDGKQVWIDEPAISKKREY